MNLRKDHCKIVSGASRGSLWREPKVFVRGDASPLTLRVFVCQLENGLSRKLLTMDLLALATMKNAAKCEIKCDLHYL